MDLFNRKTISHLEEEIANLRAQLAEAEAQTRRKDPPALAERVADLEVKMAKLWGVLIETTRTGKEKPTRYGRMFGGRASELKT